MKPSTRRTLSIFMRAFIAAAALGFAIAVIIGQVGCAGVAGSASPDVAKAAYLAVQIEAVRTTPGEHQLYGPWTGAPWLVNTEHRADPVSGGWVYVSRITPPPFTLVTPAPVAPTP